MRIKRRTKRFFRRVLIAIPILLVCSFLYLLLRRPSSARPASITVAMSSDRIERGQYLFTTLCFCDGCHSERDVSRLGLPVIASGRGKGGIMPIKGLPGQIVATNITPDKETGIGNWTDGEKIRAIREGIGRDGRAMFPLMPYTNYRYLSDVDVQSLVAYMNSLPPIRNPLPKTQINFPVSMFIKGVPSPVTNRIPRVDEYGGEIYGEYLVTLASCEECHTPPSTGILTKGQPDSSKRFAGGRLFSTPDGDVVSSNITPDKETGIGRWDYVRFRDRIRSFRGTEPPKVGPERFTVMPWIAYANLNERDLSAIFLYIKSRAPISNKVVPHPGFPNQTN
jgi:hypothetical protein